MQRICVFCGSNPGTKETYGAAAGTMGRLLAERGIDMVYGGANRGLMGIAADAALDAGGTVIGVIPEALVAWEVAHDGLTELHVVDSMHTRKQMMADLSDGFIALPGGFGTFEEFCEILTWAQLGIHTKPCGILNVDGYYDPLMALFDRAVEDGFLPPEHRALVIEESDPARLLDLLASATPPGFLPVIEPEET
jgi:uncharacterized protein (TIGR00730 family)